MIFSGKFRENSRKFWEIFKLLDCFYDLNHKKFNFFAFLAPKIRKRRKNFVQIFVAWVNFEELQQTNQKKILKSGDVT